MSSKIDEEISELVTILATVNCPLLIRTDDWWIEELLFKPGKPRTDLICWTISQTSSGFFSSDLDSTNVSMASSSSNHKFPDSDEAIHDFLNSCGIFRATALSFVKGLLPKDDQMKYWQKMIKPLYFLRRTTINTDVAFGTRSLNSYVLMDNFLDTFSDGAFLLPPDIKSEIEQNSLKKGENPQLESYTVLERNPLQDKLCVQNCCELADRVAVDASKFMDTLSELKICLPKKNTSAGLIEIGNEIDLITSKMEEWKTGMDSLLKMQNTNSETNQKKAETVLIRSTKDKSFKPFQNLCEQCD